MKAIATGRPDTTRARRDIEARKRRSKGARLRPGHEYHLSSLSKGMRRALRILLLEGHVSRQTKFWRSSAGTGIPFETVLALYDRHLVRVIVESRDISRSRQSAALTEIGQLVAERLLISEKVASGEWISEGASRLIASLTDNFEESPTVYAPEPEAEVLEP